MDDIHLPAPEVIADLYSLFAWIMPESDRHYFGSYSLSEVVIYETDITLDLFTIQMGSCDPYISIWYTKGLTDRLWCKDIHKYEQKPSKKRSY